MNKYEIIGVIDEGAYGVVMKAQNKVTKQLVAIKRFKDSDEDHTVYRNIQREIQMLKSFKSQYVVDLKQAFRKKGRVYLIFEYIDRNLLNIIEEHEDGVPKKLISQIIYRLVRSIHHLHSHNAVHRDIKPQNILVSLKPQIQLRLCDFGFTRLISSTKMTDYVATRWYRSPQLLVGENYGKQVDMWAVGCIMGEMIDGQPMFPGENELDQIYQIKKAFGSLTAGQESILKSSRRFQGIKFPEIKIREPLQVRYLNRIQKAELSFLKGCLKVDPNERLTAFEALRHPYLRQYSIKETFLHQEAELLENRKRSHPQISTMSLKQTINGKNATISGKKFSLQAIFSKELGKRSILNQYFSPRKLAQENTQSLMKRQTLSILPRLPGQKSVSIPKGHTKASSLQLKISKIKTIYNNFPLKLRQSKEKHSKKGK